MPNSERKTSFTGRSRDRKTSPGVKWADRISKAVITIGGLGTIVAVMTVCIFLVYETIPLFQSPRVEDAGKYEHPWKAHGRTSDQIVHTVIDEYLVMGASIFDDGTIQVFRLDNGMPLGEPIRPFGDAPATAYHFSSDRDDASFGFADGTARLGNMGFRITFINEQAVPEALRDMPARGVADYEDGVLFRTDAGQFRHHRFYYEFKDPIELAGASIRLIAHTIRNTGPVIVALSEDNQLTLNSISEVRNFLTGKVTPTVSKAVLPYRTPNGLGKPAHMLVTGLGDTVYLAWENGLLHRFDTRVTTNVRLAEEVRLINTPGVKLTAMKFMIGRTTFLTGDSEGSVTAWFRVKPENAATPDGQELRPTHVLGTAGSPVTTITASARSRLAIAGFADGRMRLYQVTTNQVLAEFRTPQDMIVHSIAMGAKDDGIIAIGPKGVALASIDRKHPAVNFASIFGPVWYEGYEAPSHLWQSSSGTDDFEPKYGLIPLIFGTIKATFYSMLFGLPIALMAAIYTSEFLHPRTKARIKPTIEMMASLPSVVLGFLAALVIAPMIESIVPGAIMAFFVVPLGFLIGAYLWQMLPITTSIRLRPYRFWFIMATIPVSLLATLGYGAWPGVGKIAERLLFAGDIKLYLDGQIGSGIGGWLILLLPISALAVGVFSSIFVNPRIRTLAGGWTRGQMAVLDLIKFIVLALLTLGVGLTLALLLTGIGMDPRGDGLDKLMGTYVQRNALVVGFIMGFAIIPIIYTIAEDALSSVPEHLRSASLGSGATPWQTAIRIIVPTAMSGMFSAVMIGLGRAVGETMIVLMAAGNTPVMQMNIFNGFRTLSANIAVELPEAPVGGTHYRVLFLAALTLFVMTFVVNTIAEVIRQRFRKRAYQL
jgi:phosphate transport system permease protein